MTILGKDGLAAVAVTLLAALGAMTWVGCTGEPAATAPPAPLPPAAGPDGKPIPRLIDLGSKTCIPCRMMAPILDDLKATLNGRLDVQFLDVSLPENRALAEQFKVELIPTQVFLAPDGKELGRHVGFISRWGILDKWRELGYDFAVPALGSTFSRMEPATHDPRPKDQICYMCDRDIDPRTLVVVRTDKGDVRLCGLHCYFIMYSCLMEDKTGLEKKVSVTDWADGKTVAASDAAYLYGADEKTGRPTVKAFASREAAEKERQASGGSILAWNALQQKELETRCGFCDRAVYPQDAAEVITADGLHTWGCCSHCALGVAARTGKNIEVHERDRLTGDPIVVRTIGGYVASIEPPGAVAWFGLRKKPDGTFVSAGCFHQGFFTSAENLRKWAEKNPAETGKMIPIDQVLADKMKMSPEQIKKACKIGECAPK